MACKLGNVDWDFELAYLNTEQSFERFAYIMEDISEQCIPFKVLTDKKPPWSTRPPTSLINQRQAAWSRYKSVRSRLGRRSQEALSSYSSFVRVNQQCRSFAVNAQAKHEEDLIHRSSEHPKLLHSYLRHKKVGRPSVGPLKLSCGKLSDDPSCMAELFAESFSSVYSRTIPPNPYSHQQFDESSLDHMAVTDEEVLKALLNLDGNSSMGPDEIHPLVLKKCAAQLAHPLAIVFNRSLREGTLPSIWKLSLVVPLFKKGLRSDPLNYRPISLTSVPCKLLERLICNSLVPYLESNGLMNPHQFGFRAGRSTMDQLLLVYDSVSKRTDEGAITDVILFDFSKAFDVVVHQLLLDKLLRLNISGNILQWISSFLKGRSMRVCVKGHKSNLRPVLSGVPQGSVLGPILFLIYVNSIACQLKSNYKIFADDLKIYSSFEHRADSASASLSYQVVQNDIDTLLKTASSWGLQMNAKKCVVLRFARPCPNPTQASYFIEGIPIPSADHATDLGILVDVNLKFHGHARNIAHKAGGLAEGLLKSTVCRSAPFMLSLLTSHIRPILEYCSCVWNTGYAKDLQLLERVQRRWTRHIDGMSGLDYGERLRALDLYSVQGRLLRADLIQYWKILNGHSCILPNVLFQRPYHGGTRGHDCKVFPPVTNTDTRKRFFSVRCIRLWNKLPPDAACATNINTLKRILDTCIHDRLFDFVG